MRKSAKLITALSISGLAVVAGSAFTGAGLATGTQAGQDQFIGGTVTQDVKGATLESLVYGFTSDDAQTAVNKVTLTFAAEAVIVGKIPTVELSGGTAATFTCGAISASYISVCDAAQGTSQSDVDSASVTVASTNAS